MADGGTVVIKIDGDTKGFANAMKSVGGIAGKGLGVLAGATTALTVAAGSAITGLAAIGVKYNADMEMYTSNFKVMLGSQEAAVKKVAELKEFAAKTPFGMKDLAESTKTLLAFQVPAEQASDTLKMLGDVALGNKDKLKSLALVFGQTTSAGRLMGQDLLQYINVGFNPLNEISKKTGESMEELRDRMSKGAISAEEVAEAFKSATSAGGQFYKGMDEASKTVQGLTSTLKDETQALIGTVFLPISESIGQKLLPEVLGYIKEMSTAFEAEGVDGLIAAAGRIVSEMVTEIAAGAPQFIDSAIDIVESFLQGIDNNSEKIADGAIRVVKSLADGLIRLAPQIVKIGANIVLELAKGLATHMPLFKPLDSIVKLIVNNFRLITVSSSGVLAGFLAFKAVTSVTAIFKTASKAIDVFRVAQTALMVTQKVATLTTQKATLAQAALNFVMNLNPVMLIVTGIVALTAAIGAFILTSNKSTDAEKERQKALEDSVEATAALAEKSKDAQKAYEDSVTSIKNGAETKLAEIDYTQRLADELLRLADESGNVSEKDKIRAQYILGELNTALGTEYSMTENQINKFGELKQSIDEVIESEQARVIAAAYSEMMSEAIKSEVEQRAGAKKATEEYRTAQEASNGIIEEYIAWVEKGAGVTLSHDEAVKRLTEDEHLLFTTGKKLSENYEQMTQSMDNSRTVMSAYGETVAQVQATEEQAAAATQAILEKNYTDVINNATLTASEKKAINEMSEAELIQGIIDTNAEIIYYEGEKSKAVSEKDKAFWQKMIDTATVQGGELVKKYEASGKDAVQGVADALKNTGMAEAEAYNFGQKVIEGFRQGIDAHSPSREAMKVAATIPQGAALAIKKGTPDVMAVAKKMLDFGQLRNVALGANLMGARGAVSGTSSTTHNTIDHGITQVFNAPQMPTPGEAYIRALSAVNRRAGFAY